MIHHRREAVLGHQPYLMARDDGSDTQTNVVSKSVPTSTMIVAIVLSVVGLLFFVVVAFFAYRAWKRRGDGSVASVPVSKKKGRQDMLHMHVDLEAASVADEKDDPELEKPKRAVLAANNDDTSFWHTSIDGKNDEIEPADQYAEWIPQIKSTMYGTGILAPKPSFQSYTQPKSPQGPRAMNDAVLATSSQPSQPVQRPNSARDDGTPSTSLSTYSSASTQRAQPVEARRPVHCTTPSLTSSELFAVSPPPSYSAANRLGVLSRVADIDVLEQRRSRIETDTESVAASPPALRSARTHAPSPFPLAASSRSNLDVSHGIAIPLASPTRSESRISMNTNTPGSYASSYLRHVKNGSQTSLGRASPNAERSELPRLMTVVNTFVPNLEDELSIKVGDTIRMLEEFKDGWCTVQYVGKYDADKGVVPRICLRERRSIVPIRKSSISSLSSAGSFRR
ncbi:hypothetical protein D9756_001269 [Leucocoprinus leucothites]|uniref:SH3 domain-containing protein n=1 Tax=Leucocoprinus leucothites TaxID=201217 RepID=A0A8H5G4W2_9AGAR|nr:hypothetical protein D9756_001269 [Leucoagaricus leucothites]